MEQESQGAGHDQPTVPEDTFGHLQDTHKRNSHHVPVSPNIDGRDRCMASIDSHAIHIA